MQSSAARRSGQPEDGEQCGEGPLKGRGWAGLLTAITTVSNRLLDIFLRLCCSTSIGMISFISTEKNNCISLSPFSSSHFEVSLLFKTQTQLRSDRSILFTRVTLPVSQWVTKVELLVGKRQAG